MSPSPTTLYGRVVRQAADHFVKHGEFLPLPEWSTADLQRQRACFITLIENPGQRVRSMAGHLLPQYPTLMHELIATTVEVLTADPLRRVRRMDLRQLVYGISLISPLQRVSDVAHLQPAQYGLYVTSDRGKSTILLPRRAGVETADDQLATALREAGISPREEAVTMYRFGVDYYDS